MTQNLEHFWLNMDEQIQDEENLHQNMRDIIECLIEYLMLQLKAFLRMAAIKLHNLLFSGQVNEKLA